MWFCFVFGLLHFYMYCLFVAYGFVWFVIVFVCCVLIVGGAVVIMCCVLMFGGDVAMCVCVLCYVFVCQCICVCVF